MLGFAILPTRGVRRQGVLLPKLPQVQEAARAASEVPAQEVLRVDNTCHLCIWCGKLVANHAVSTRYHFPAYSCLEEWEAMAVVWMLCARTVPCGLTTLAGSVAAPTTSNSACARTGKPQGSMAEDACATLQHEHGGAMHARAAPGRTRSAVVPRWVLLPR